MSAVRIRPFTGADTEALTALLYAIIAEGGTTAYEQPLTPDTLRRKHLDGASVLCCHTAVLNGVPVGFQTLGANPELPAGWGDIASFTRCPPAVKGAGTALFQATVEQARALGLTHLNATIRADNVPGLAYYTKMGFADRRVIPAVPLSDGTPVDRVQKTFPL